MTFQSFEESWRQFCRLSLGGICLMFCSWRDWGYGFGEGRPQRWSALPITSHQGLSSPNMTHAWCSPWSSGWAGFNDFLHYKVFSFPPPFHTVFFERKSLWVAHTEESRVIYSPPPRGGASGFFYLGDLSILPRWSVQSFYYISMGSWYWSYLNGVCWSNSSCFAYWGFKIWL